MRLTVADKRTIVAGLEQLITMQTQQILNCQRCTQPDDEVERWELDAKAERARLTALRDRLEAEWTKTQEVVTKSLVKVWK